MSQTRLALINFIQGQWSAETLGAQILRLENYLSVSPVHPTGGPDGGKDIRAKHLDGRNVIGGCYFPHASGDKSFKTVEKKFLNDLDGAKNKNGAHIFIFLTNTELTDGEEKTLCEHGSRISCFVDVFDLDRITQILDHPRGFALRFQTFKLQMSNEEQISFFNLWEQTLMEEVRRMSGQLNVVSTDVGEIKRILTDFVNRPSATGQASTDGDERAFP